MKYFKPEETACPCCGKTIALGHPIWIAVDTIRRRVGKPFKITSGFRCEAYNKTLKNSSPKSKHVEGCAMDISTENLDGYDKYILVKEAMTFKLRIGIYAKHIHVDYSPTEPSALWYGNY